MRISKTTAMHIVRELANVIGHDLTFMDTTAHIIACTDETRIGAFHGASKKMLEENLSFLTVLSDDEYEGTRMGVNTTIVIETEVVAVVGITGEYETVEKFVRIVKHMTEILLLDEINKDQKLRMQAVRDRYIYEWIFSNNNWVTKDFYFQGLSVGVDVSVPRRIVLLTMKAPDKINEHWEKVEQAVRECLKGNSQSLWIVNGYKLIMLVPEVKDEAIREMTQRIWEKLQDMSIEVFFGADSVPTWSESTHAGYLRAEKALLSNRNGQAGGVIFYRDIDVEIFLQEVSNNAKQEFIAKIFKGLNQQEIAHWCHVLTVFYQSNGSIGTAAQKLYLHKNTLQYQLNKLRQVTGYDPRDLEESSLFYIAIRMWNSLNF